MNQRLNGRIPTSLTIFCLITALVLGLQQDPSEASGRTLRAHVAQATSSSKESASAYTSVDTLAFAATPLTHSRDLDYRIYNVGNDTLSGTVSLSATFLSFSILNGTEEFAVAPMDSHLVQVHFEPIGLGDYEIVANNGPDCNSVSITASAFEAIVIEPDSVNFGQVAIGDTVTTILEFTNTSDDILHVEGYLFWNPLYVPGPYYVTNVRPREIFPGATDSMVVLFAPTRIYEWPCWPDMDMYSSRRIYLYGEGIDPEATSASPPPARPRTNLRQNHPNPFNPITRIEFELGRAAHVELKVYGPGGRLIRTLVDEHKNAGAHFVDFDGSDGQGFSLASGVYFYRLRTGSTQFTRRMALVR